MNVYLIQSFSLRLLHDEIKKIIGDATNVVRMNMDEIDISHIMDECSYYTLIDEPKYVIVNNFKTNKDNNGLDVYFKNPNPNTILILIADTIDKRNALYKLISDKGYVIIIDDVKDINNKINNYAKDKGFSIDYLAINKLLENNLNNYDLVLNEIDKIGQYIPKITIEEAEKYSSKLISEDNFEFCDAVINKDFKKINTYLEDFTKLKSEITPFISLLANKYRLMYAVKCLNGTNDELAKKLNVHPYPVKLAKEKAHSYSKDELQKKLLDLCDLDYNIKTSNVDKYILFKIFIINI